MKKIFIGMLKLYQKSISPVVKQMGFECKFYPSCSEYMRQAIEKYGCIKGFFLGMKRLIKCNPFSKGGYDPLK